MLNMGEEKKRYYNSHVDFFNLLQKIKLWPSRNGVLHGIRKITLQGDYAEITTHCGSTFIVKNSRKSRAARWLRNKWIFNACPKCKIPGWKLEKYASTFYSDHYGSHLNPTKNQPEA
jgi:pyrrolysyl-tRNA synthetase-like protein